MYAIGSSCRLLGDFPQTQPAGPGDRYPVLCPPLLKMHSFSRRWQQHENAMVASEQRESCLAPGPKSSLPEFSRGYPTLPPETLSGTAARTAPQTPPPHAPGPFGRLGAPVADFGLPLAPFGVPLGSLWPSFGVPLAILGHPLAPFGVPSGSLWPSFGVPLAIVGPKGRLWGQSRAGPGRPLGQ